MQVLPAPGERRRLVVLLAVLAIVAVAAPVVRATRDDAAGPSERWLSGRTDQGKSLRLLVDTSGRVEAVDTHVDSRCRGGYSWGVDWTPAEGFARFSKRGDRVTVREFRTTKADGHLQRVLVRLVGHVNGDAGSGTVRLQARFFKAGVETQACESAPRRWAVGPGAKRRLADAPAVRPPGAAYWPRVPSLAGKVSAARRRFIARTDRTCVATFGPTQVALRAVSAAAGDPRRQLAAYGDYVDAHSNQLRALEALGRPPDGAAWHRRWLDNFRTRVRMERRVERLWAAGEIARARAVHRRLGPLKMRGNTAGQRFGLQVCTSNGPDRSPTRR